MIKSLYVHIPFCKKKCSYCDFTSFVECSGDYEKYTMALLEELKYKMKLTGARELNTIYIGGGTPTVLPPSLLEKILSFIKKEFSFVDNYEYTVEGNPESITKEKLTMMKAYGVNRISMGAQSVNDTTLDFLGRVHNESDIYKAFHLAREVGFENINIDFIYGIPGEDPESWNKTLAAGANLDPEHISMYQLKIEEETLLYEKLLKNEIETYPDDMGEKIYLKNLDFLSKRGYENYEVSNFAKSGFASKHNLTYWNYLPYLAVGFGGVSFWGDKRSQFKGTLKEYILSNNFSEENFSEEVLTQDEQISEYIIMNLRKVEGFSEEDFFRRFNVSFLEIYSKQVDKLVAKGMLNIENNWVSLTLQGRLLGNLVFEEFV